MEQRSAYIASASPGIIIPTEIKFIPLSYDHRDSRGTALRLILAALPEWSGHEDTIDLSRCTEGITNTLLKVVNRRQGATAHEVEEEAVMLRAYGNGTDVIIDRTKEVENHKALMRHGLAPPLLAQFRNGMIYRYVPGTVMRPSDLHSHPISLAIARHLAQWHAILPCPSYSNTRAAQDAIANTVAAHKEEGNDKENELAPKEFSSTVSEPHDNLWTVMHRWISALPVETKEQRTRQEVLRAELSRSVNEFVRRPGLGQSLVFAHCDLLCGNIILLPGSSAAEDGESQPSVRFIDYEYATPSPAAFDIANHFAEWGGFDCDYNAMPTQAQRRLFVLEYVRTYFGLLARSDGQRHVATAELETEATKLMAEIDEYRGIPGLYWGIWASIQAVISEIDFDYSSYADLRLAEYWAWRAQRDGSLSTKSCDMPLRESKWAQAE